MEHAEGELPRELAQTAAAGGEPLKVDADEDRKPRTIEEMVKEAEWLRTFFEAEEGKGEADP